jgi:hypothetical protein
MPDPLESGLKFRVGIVELGTTEPATFGCSAFLALYHMGMAYSPEALYFMDRERPALPKEGKAKCSILRRISLFFCYLKFHGQGGQFLQ